MLCDIIAFALGFVISKILVEYITVNILGNVYVAIADHEINIRMFAFGLKAAAALFIFYNRGHYKRAIPWWSPATSSGARIGVIEEVEGEELRNQGVLDR